MITRSAKDGASCFGTGLTKPTDVSGPSPYVGQWGSLSVQLSRLVAGIAHEIVVLLREQLPVVESPDFQALVEALPRDRDRRLDSKKRWAEIMDLVHDRKGASHALLLVRNALAFHYPPRMLMQCYVEHFAKNASEPPISSRGFVSLGDSMERTRFYHADAAAQDALEWAGEQGNVTDFGAALEEVVVAINIAIGPLLAEHLRRRLGLLGEQRRSSPAPRGRPRPKRRC